jgi:hypothetical protein
MMHLREFFDDLIRLLKEFLGLGDRDAWKCGRHVEEISFMQRRHKFTA